MKLSITVLLCSAGVVACSQGRPPQGPTTSVASTPPARFETAQGSETAPPAASIVTVAAPMPAAAPPPDQPPLTPASGNATPRAASAQLVPTDSARDQPQSDQDRESIREIRALLASDKTLAPSAAQVTIVARNGRVVLRGQVNTAEQRSAIERAARQAVGVMDVKNQLVVME